MYVYGKINTYYNNFIIYFKIIQYNIVCYMHYFIHI